MTAVILKIIGLLIPLVFEWYGDRNSPVTKAKREDKAFDKALADNDADTLTELFSSRIDRVSRR